MYRIESAVDTPASDRGDGKRLYTDDYLVELSSPTRTVVFESMTERDDHIVFRSQVESMIKTFQFRPAEVRPTAAPVSTSPSPSSTQPRTR